MKKETPTRTVQLSAYYDAAATTKESDYGTFLNLSEDFHFTGSTRSVTLSRLRREVRNNPYLCGLVNSFPCAVGVSNLRSRTSSKAYNDAKEKFWFRWKKRVTRSGASLRAVEDIIARELLVAGEIFIVLLANGQIQLIPSEFCGSASGAIASVRPDGTREINGIVTDAQDRPLQYRFGRLTPTGVLSFADADTTLVAANFVIHVYLQDRCLMGRGLPWLLACLRPAHDLYEITRSKTKQIKDANAISGTIESVEGEKILQGLTSKAAASIAADTTVAETAADAADKTDETPVVVELKPGTFIALKPGEKLNMLKTQYQASDYKELVMLMLHAIATPVGLPVELWFSGLGDVAYSGFKGLGTQWNARRRYYLGFLEDNYLNRLHFWRISKAKKEGDLAVENPDGDEDLIDWAWRRTAVLDEEKEAKANQVRLASGQSSLADIWEADGFYAEEVFAHRRALWIQLEIAAGNLEPAADHSAVKVPREFLLRGALPGQNPYPYLPAGDGAPEDGKPGAPAPRPAQDPAPADDEEDPADDETTAADADLVARLRRLFRRRPAAKPARN